MQVYPDTFKKKSNEDDLYNICLGVICGSLCCIIIMVSLIILFFKPKEREDMLLSNSGSY